MQLQWFRNPEEFEIRIGSGLEIKIMAYGLLRRP